MVPFIDAPAGIRARQANRLMLFVNGLPQRVEKWQPGPRAQEVDATEKSQKSAAKTMSLGFVATKRPLPAQDVNRRGYQRPLMLLR